MIPRAHITAWRAAAPWPTDAQIEQELVISRALVEIFASELLARELAFRGGTAIHKLFLERPGRYSEDIDLVQIPSGPIGPVLDELRRILGPWLGAARVRRGADGVALVHRFETSSSPVQASRLKVEIQTREHHAMLGTHRRPFAVRTLWFEGRAEIGTYRIEEVLATKLRALFQRRKGRDLYDLWLALSSLEIDAELVVRCFGEYNAREGLAVSPAEFEANLEEKLATPAFGGDIAPLLPTGTSFDAWAAFEAVHRSLLSRLPGQAWKGRRPPQ